MSKGSINIDLSLINLGTLHKKRVILGLKKPYTKHNYYNFFFFRKKFDSPLIYFFLLLIVFINLLSVFFLSYHINLVLNFNKGYFITPTFNNVNLKNDDSILIISKLFSFLSLL